MFWGEELVRSRAPVVRLKLDIGHQGSHVCAHSSIEHTKPISNHPILMVNNFEPICFFSHWSRMVWTSRYPISSGISSGFLSLTIFSGFIVKECQFLVFLVGIFYFFAILMSVWKMYLAKTCKKHQSFTLGLLKSRPSWCNSPDRLGSKGRPQDPGSEGDFNPNMSPT